MNAGPAARTATPTRPPATLRVDRRNRITRRTWILIKVATWTLALIPFALLLWDTLTGQLQAEPVKDLTHRTGWWALALLLVALAVTPLRYLTGWTQIVRFRRLVGLFAFFYASLHVLIYFGLDQMLALDYIIEDIVERPYITVGFTAWLILIPLAVTSTNGWMRRLGSRWKKLHRLVYVAAGLGVLHFYWLVKADTREPLVFAGMLGVLLAIRLPFIRRWITRFRRPALHG